MRRIRTIAILATGALGMAAYAALFREYIKVLSELNLLHAYVNDLNEPPSMEEVLGYVDARPAGDDSIQVFGPRGQGPFGIRLVEGEQVEIFEMPGSFSYDDIAAILGNTYLAATQMGDGRVLVSAPAQRTSPDDDLLFVAMMLAAAVRERNGAMLKK